MYCIMKLSKLIQHNNIKMYEMLLCKITFELEALSLLQKTYRTYMSYYLIYFYMI